MSTTRSFVVRTWPLLLSLAVLVMLPWAISLTREGRVAAKAAIYLPDMMVALPVRPVEWVSAEPSRERITLQYESREGTRSIVADLYTPAGDATGRRGIVFSMGSRPLPLDDERLVRIAEDTARAGVVILVPFSERLDEMRIEPEEIDALVAAFEYVQAHPQVDPDRVGYFGASVGGSLALVASADPRIAADVDQVVSFGGYYDALDTFGAIATERISYGDVDETWDPRWHAKRVMAHQLINALDSESDREMLTRWYLEREGATSGELATVSPVARDSYEFLTNDDPAAVQELISRLPEDAVADLEYLSPRTHIDNLSAELFIVHDRADPFIPYTESRRLQEAIGDRGDAHFDEIRLFEHVTPQWQQRPDVVLFDGARVLFRMYQLLLTWER